MRNANWPAVAGAAALVAGCGAILAGCAVPPTSVRSAAPPTRAAADVAAHRTPPQRAPADVAAMLAAFLPPPHAARTGPLPVKLLAQPGMETMSANQVERTGWWRVAAPPQAVVRWIQAHKPRGFAFFGGGNGTGYLSEAGTVVSWYITVTWPDLPGVLVERELEASVAADGPHATAIRVDALAVWIPARPAAETIGASAQAVTITPLGGRHADPQVTITDPAQVARIAAAVNALPLYPPRDPMWCDLLLPPGGGARMRLTFLARAGGPEVAVVTAYQERCGLVDVAVGGKPMPALDGAQTLIQQVMAIDGARWADFPAPGPTATVPAPTAPSP